jgi:chitinase
VTWHHNVFEAKWFSQGQMPDAPVAHEWSTPWLLLGPVLPGDKPATVPKLPPGIYPAWSPKKTYLEGSRVEVDGIAYVAKWWTHGTPPVAHPQAAYDSP